MLCRNLSDGFDGDVGNGKAVVDSHGISIRTRGIGHELE